MVHGAGIQVAVIRVFIKSYHSLLGMWQLQPNAREKRLKRVARLLTIRSSVEFMGWSKWQ